MSADRRGRSTVDLMASSTRRSAAVPPAGDAHPPAGSIGRLPRRLSPSRAKDYLQCPRLFYCKTILGLPSPPSEHAARGTLTHTALERLFDHPRDERTPETAVGYVRPAWTAATDPLAERSSVTPGSPEDRIRQESSAYRDLVEPGSRQERRLLGTAQEYRSLCGPGSTEEEALLSSAEDMVRRWFEMENPKNFDPEGRELHVEATAAGVTFHGFIDRLDCWTKSDGTKVWSISDYKTGKVPGEGKHYSPQTQARIEEDAFFAMKVYALLWQQMTGVAVDVLRLVYVRTGDRSSGVKRLHVTPQMLERTRLQLNSIWRSIERSARNEDWRTQPGPLCPYCSFQDVCPAFNKNLPPLEQEVALLEGRLAEAS